jgi:hypothetical protein
MAVNFGNVVTDPAEQRRIMGLAEGLIAGNEAGAGGTLGYAPGFSRDQAVDEAAYSFFPTSSRAPGGTGMSAGSLSGAGGAAPQFTGGAPAATPYGSFAPPDVNQLNADPTYQFDLSQQQKAIQRGAAARGTLLTGGLQTKLQENASGVAGQHYGDIFNRAMASYTTNRDTNAQNFDQSLGSFNAGLGAFGANTSAGLGYGRLGLDANDQAFGQAQTLRQNKMQDTDRAAAKIQNEQQALADAYAQQVAAQRQQFGTLSASTVTPPPPAYGQRTPYQMQKWSGG